MKKKLSKIIIRLAFIIGVVGIFLERYSSSTKIAGTTMILISIILLIGYYFLMKVVRKEELIEIAEDIKKGKRRVNEETKINSKEKQELYQLLEEAKIRKEKLKKEKYKKLKEKGDKRRSN